MGENLLKKMREEDQNQRIKSAEIMEKGEEDGISALPDSLLLEILSRLPCTKDAIRTDSDHRYLGNSNSSSDFSLLVDKTLAQCRQLKLKKFQVITFYDIRFESQFNNWIRFAIGCNVEELILNSEGSKTLFLLDQPIFINSYFTYLRLGECKLNPSGAINWENLKSLCLSRVNVDQDLIVNILSGSPHLETLVLESCWWPNINGIGAPTSRLSLTQCRQLKHLKKFKVDISYDIQFQSQLNNLILFAIRCNVKEVDLGLWNIGSGYEFFMLDQGFFTDACFTKLKVFGCMLINPVGAISWKSLRSLCISKYKSLDENLIETILSGSPVLETLVLDDCYGYRRLNITSKRVKNLVLFGFDVDYYGESEADIIEINAPNILSLTIQSHLEVQKFLLLNLSSLVKANLSYKCIILGHVKTTPTEAEQGMLKGYIMNLSHVKELESGFYCSKVLSCLQDECFVFPSNVKLTYIGER